MIRYIICVLLRTAPHHCGDQTISPSVRTLPISTRLGVLPFGIVVERFPCGTSLLIVSFEIFQKLEEFATRISAHRRNFVYAKVGPCQPCLILICCMLCQYQCYKMRISPNVIAEVFYHLPHCFQQDRHIFSSL